MKLKPMGNRVFAKPEPLVGKVGNIYIPDKHQEKCYISTVTAVGPTWSVPEVKVGTKIISNTRGGHELVVDGEDVVIYNDYDVIGIIKEGKKGKTK